MPETLSPPLVDVPATIVPFAGTTSAIPAVSSDLVSSDFLVPPDALCLPRTIAEQRTASPATSRV